MNKWLLSMALTLCYFMVFPKINLASEDIGKSKKQIEQETKDGNISYGINDRGVAYMMDSSWDGFETWYFDDNLFVLQSTLFLERVRGRNFCLI
jgi:hypothetical protein